MPLVSGAAARWQGQNIAFNPAPPGAVHAPCYSCLVPEMPPDARDCSETGIAGPVTGMVGAQMALDAIRYLSGANTDIFGVLRILEGLSGRVRQVRVPADPACPEAARTPEAHADHD